MSQLMRKPVHVLLACLAKLFIISFAVVIISISITKFLIFELRSLALPIASVLATIIAPGIIISYFWTPIWGAAVSVIFLICVLVFLHVSCRADRDSDYSSPLRAR